MSLFVKISYKIIKINPDYHESNGDGFGALWPYSVMGDPQRELVQTSQTKRGRRDAQHLAGLKVGALATRWHHCIKLFRCRSVQKTGIAI